MHKSEWLVSYHKQHFHHISPIRPRPNLIISSNPNIRLSNSTSSPVFLTHFLILQHQRITNEYLRNSTKNNQPPNHKWNNTSQDLRNSTKNKWRFIYDVTRSSWKRSKVKSYMVYMIFIIFTMVCILMTVLHKVALQFCSAARGFQSKRLVQACMSLFCMHSYTMSCRSDHCGLNAFEL